MTRRFFRLLAALPCAVALGILLCHPSLLQGQTGGGSVIGSVHDSSGAVVRNADVTLTGTETGTTLTTKSSSAGEYVFPVVPVGVYTLSVTAQGFSRLEHQGIIVSLGKTVTVDAPLQVGAASATIKVQALSAQIETNTAQASSTIDQQTYDDLPIALAGVARSSTSVADLMPGVADNPSVGYTGGSTPTSQMYSETINGGQSWGGQTLYDGIPLVNISSGASDYRNQPIPVEALQEFTLVQNNFDPEYGRTPGGVLTYSTRSGTNAFHGQAYEYLRNNDLDAVGYFNPAGSSEPPLKQNEFGVNVGGPIIIPHLYNGRDKLHFFAFYSGFRYAAGVFPTPTIIPTLAERTGDFTGIPSPIYDPSTTTCNAVTGACTRQQYDYNGVPNVMPPTSISATGTDYIQYLPQPNIPNAAAGQVNYVPTGVNNTVENRWGGRIDADITSKDHIFGFFATGPDDTTSETTIFLPPIATYGANISPAYNTIINLGLEHTFTPNLLLHLGAGWNRFNSPSESPYSNTIVTFGIAGGLPATPQMYFAPGASPITYSSTNGTSGGTSLQYAFIENGFLSWTKGRHNLKFGAELDRDGANSFNDDSMVDALTYKETENPQSPSNSGDAFASLMAGAFDEASLYAYLSAYDLRTQYLAFYFNDTWRVTPKLVLNLGVRYEIPGTPSAVKNIFSGLDPTLPNPGAGGIPGALVFAGNGDPSTYCNCTHLVPTNYRIVQPRVGIAYQLDSNTVVHAGYGIFADANGSTYGTNSQNTSGFNASPQFVSPDNGITPAFTTASGYPAFTPPPFISPSYDNNNSINWLPKNTGLPGIISSYTLDVQHQLPNGWLVDIGYVGNSAQHLSGYLQNPQQLPIGDQILYGSALTQLLNSPAGIATGVPVPFPQFFTVMGSNATVGQALRLYPQYTGVNVENQNTAHSNYNSLQAKLQKQYRNGFSMLASYTWGRIFTTAEDFLGPFNNGPQDNYNPGFEYAPSYNEPPQTFVISYNYDLPFGYQKKWLNHGLIASLAGGWGVSGIQHYQSGNPMFEIGASNDLNIYNDWLADDYVPGQPEKGTWTGKYNPYTDAYINPKAFTSPPPNSFGNVARQIGLRGFGYYDEALSARKNFHIYQATNFQFRADFFNAFNRTYFGSINGPYTGPTSSPGWGTLPAQGNLARTIQFSAKILF